MLNLLGLDSESLQIMSSTGGELSPTIRTLVMKTLRKVFQRFSGHIPLFENYFLLIISGMLHQTGSIIAYQMFSPHSTGILWSITAVW